MAGALYGPRGFYTVGDGAAGHFRTSVAVSPVFADALAALARQVDALLGHPATFTLVDVGADRGQLLSAVVSSQRLPPDLRGRLHPVAVEHPGRVTPGNATAPLPREANAVTWLDQAPSPVEGMVVANELLDNVPVDVVEVDEAGAVRQVLVGSDGQERLGEAPDARAMTWLDTWWPLHGQPAGARAEVGLQRDEKWSQLVGSVERGAALAIDYGHRRGTRRAHLFGTLAGFRGGRAVPVVPDGSCDITAHVAMDACAAAGESAGAGATLLLTQRDALRRLGVSGRVPDRHQAADDPAAYVRLLSRAGAEAELLDPEGLGGFTWLIQSRGVDVPSVLAES
jgi:SAM-dependent MidA family methyltransferase